MRLATLVSLFIILLCSCIHAQTPEMAFVNVNVVPMDQKRILSQQTVIVKDGKIIAVGPAAKIKVPKGARRIDGTGKYLMPGLADMHVRMTTGRGDPISDSFCRNMWLTA